MSTSDVGLGAHCRWVSTTSNTVNIWHQISFFTFPYTARTKIWNWLIFLIFHLTQIKNGWNIVLRELKLKIFPFTGSGLGHEWSLLAWRTKCPVTVEVTIKTGGKNLRKCLGVVVDILPGKPGGLLVVPERLLYAKLPKSAFAERHHLSRLGCDVRRRPTCHWTCCFALDWHRRQGVKHVCQSCWASWGEDWKRWQAAPHSPPHHMKELLAPTDPEVCSSSAATPGKVFAKTWTVAYLEDGFVRRLHSKASFPREGTSHCGTSTWSGHNMALSSLYPPPLQP